MNLQSEQWQVKPPEDDKPYLRIRGTDLCCRFKIANVLTPEYVFNPEVRVTPESRERELGKTQEYAHLIAAAPQLLAFAEYVAQCTGETLHTKALEVIAQAKGQVK